MSRHPEVKWAERLHMVYITILLPDAKNVKVNLEPDGLFTFSATAGADANLYELKLNLHGKVNVEGSKINTGYRNVFCVVEKAEKDWWLKLLRGEAKTPHYVKVDWEKWADEDDDDDEGLEDFALDGMEFANFGDNEDIDGSHDDDDDDDVEEEEENSDNNDDDDDESDDDEETKYPNWDTYAAENADPTGLTEVNPEWIKQMKKITEERKARMEAKKKAKGE